jgi:hypothetical protein
MALRGSFLVAAVSSMLVVALGACAPLRWTRPNFSPEAFAADDAECRQWAARKAFHAGFFGFGYYPRYTWAYPWGRHWPGWPYYWDPFGPGALAWEMEIERELRASCLKARGYRLEPAQEPLRQGESQR